MFNLKSNTRIYHYDPYSYVFTHSEFADLDPKNLERVLVPKFATLQCVPEFGKNQIPVFDEEQQCWNIVPFYKQPFIHKITKKIIYLKVGEEPTDEYTDQMIPEQYIGLEQVKWDNDNNKWVLDSKALILAEKQKILEARDKVFYKHFSLIDFFMYIKGISLKSEKIEYYFTEAQKIEIQLYHELSKCEENELIKRMKEHKNYEKYFNNILKE